MTQDASRPFRRNFCDDFGAPALDPTRWSPYYLPHWSARASSAATYRLTGHSLVLGVGPDQPPWCPEFDGDIRVSALQTGQRSGPVGSGVGQHRFRDGLVVREAQPEQRLYTPTRGRIEMRARASMNPVSLVSLYLIGFEDVPERSGEITVMEVFGRGVEEGRAVVGRGIKAVNDPALTTEFVETALPIRIGDWHEWSIDWTPDGVAFHLDGDEIARSEQSPDYPMQLMLTAYELGPTPAGADPVEFEIDRVRGYAPV